jgi:hypothetical protein
MNGRFQVIYTDGKVREFENRAYFFTAARFSADGQAMVGSLGRDLVVTNQSFEILWKVRPSNPNILTMALSPSKTQVAFMAMAGGSEFSLGLIKSSGEELTLASIERRDADDSGGISWSPEEDRLVYGSTGHVKIINVLTKASETLGDGFEPTWSPNGNGSRTGVLMVELNCTTSQHARGRCWRGGTGSPRRSTGRQIRSM